MQDGRVPRERVLHYIDVIKFSLVTGEKYICVNGAYVLDLGYNRSGVNIISF